MKKRLFRAVGSVCAAGIIAVCMSGCGLSEEEKAAKKKEEIDRFNLEWRIDLPYDWDLVAAYTSNDLLTRSYYEVRKINGSVDFAADFSTEKSEQLEDEWNSAIKKNYINVAAENAIDFTKEYVWFAQNRIPDNHQVYDVGALKDVKRYVFCEGIRPNVWEGRSYDSLYVIFVPTENLLYLLNDDYYHW